MAIVAATGAAGNFSSGSEWVLFSPLIVVSTFFHHIHSVILRSSKEKMIGINARRIIATMTNKHAFGNNTIEKFPSITMSLYLFLSKMEFTISMIRLGIAFPIPTLINPFFIYKRIISFFNCRRLIIGISMSIPSFPMLRTISMTLTKIITTLNFTNLLSSSVDNIRASISNKTKIMLITVSKSSTKLCAVFNFTDISHIIHYSKLQYQEQEEVYLWLL